MMLSIKKIFQLVGIACAMMGMSQSLFAATGNITFTNEDCGTLSIVLFEGDQAATDSIGKHDWAKGTFLGPRNQIIVIENGETKVIPVAYDTSKMITAVLYEGKKSGLMYTAGGSRLRGVGSYVKTMGRCSGAQCSTSIKQDQMCCERGGYTSYNNLGYKSTLPVEANGSYTLWSQSDGGCDTRKPGDGGTTPGGDDGSGDDTGTDDPDDDTGTGEPTEPTEPTPVPCVPSNYENYGELKLSNTGGDTKFKNCTGQDNLYLMLFDPERDTKTAPQAFAANGELVYKSGNFNDTPTKLMLIECKNGSGTKIIEWGNTEFPTHPHWVIHKEGTSYKIEKVNEANYAVCYASASCSVPSAYAAYGNLVLPNTGNDVNIKNCSGNDNVQMMLIKESKKSVSSGVVANNSVYTYKSDDLAAKSDDLAAGSELVLFECQKSSDSSEYKATELNRATVDPAVHTSWMVTNDFNVIAVNQSNYDGCTIPPAKTCPYGVFSQENLNALYPGYSYQKMNDREEQTFNSIPNNMNTYKRYIKNCLNKAVYLVFHTLRDDTKKRSDIYKIVGNEGEFAIPQSYENRFKYVDLYECNEVGGPMPRKRFRTDAKKDDDKLILTIDNQGENKWIIGVKDDSTLIKGVKDGKYRDCKLK